MTRRMALFPVLVLLWCSTLSAAQPAIYTINDESIARLRKAYPLATAEVDDPVYKRKQRYQGFWLSDVLKELATSAKSESGLYLRFRCKDGYLPVMPLARAQKGKALIAIRDLDAPDGKSWQPNSDNGVVSTPAPSYLVWISPTGPVEEYPWPYQMVAIEIVNAAEALGHDASGGSTGSDGEGLFTAHCLKCHSINGTGGTMGPELNSPCSVTEYWNPGYLKQFIANPRSIRAQSKMPGFESLPQKDIQTIVSYLQFMSGHKKAGAACPSQQ